MYHKPKTKAKSPELKSLLTITIYILWSCNEKKKEEKHYREPVATLIFRFVNISQIFLSNNTCQTYVNNQSMCCVELFAEEHN